MFLKTKDGEDCLIKLFRPDSFLLFPLDLNRVDLGFLEFAAIIDVE